MKKVCFTVYLLIMALFVLTMSGCGGSSSSGGGSTTQSAQSKRMVFTSPALKRNGNYNLYRGEKVNVMVGTQQVGISSKYYLAPVTRGNENITMNLEFSNAVSQDLPFMITDADNNDAVLFYYNPKGTGTDTTTTNVTRYGGSQQKLSYSNLTLTGSSVELDDSDAIEVVLNSDGTATAGGNTIPDLGYIWHADPQHPEQYWTKSGDSTVLYEDRYEAAIESSIPDNGIYINHDIRYTPSGLGFTTSNTATKDEDTEYVVYYDLTAEANAEALADLSNDYGADYGKAKYIFATLPMSNGMGGGGTPPDGGNGMPSGDMPGGNPPNMQSGNMPTPPNGDTRMPMMSAATDDSSIAAVSTMTHSASDAYNNPVLHITKAGTYKISGKWHGQIWIEAGAKATHQVALILNGVEVSCDVAPALVFYKVYKWAEDNGYDDQDTLTANNLWRTLSNKMLDDEGYYTVGAIVEIADGKTNTFTGANTYRILELSPKLDDDTGKPKYSASEIGSNISAQQKMYKLDGAFHSRRSIIIGGGSEETGTLTITSTTCEGLDSEMHMLIESGIINVTAPDDAINVNEDNVSVFTMDSGTLSASSTNADGIDSNGWIVVNGGTLNITAGNTSIGSAGESGMDAENANPYISDNATYNWTAASGGNTTPGGNGNTDSGNSNTDNGNTNTDNGSTNTNTDTGNTTGYSIISVVETSETVGDSVFTLFPSDSSVATDTEGTRNISSSGSTFPLVHRVNDFAGIK